MSKVKRSRALALKASSRFPGLRYALTVHEIMLT